MLGLGRNKQLHKCRLENNGRAAGALWKRARRGALSCREAAAGAQRWALQEPRGLIRKRAKWHTAMSRELQTRTCHGVLQLTKESTNTRHHLHVQGGQGKKH